MAHEAHAAAAPAWRRPRKAAAALALTALVALLIVHAASFFFLCEDAFISFRFARNLLDGKGLVFNAGERVEGYTNFLWVLEIAALWKLGLRPETSSILLSALYTAGTLVLLAAFAASSGDRRRVWTLLAALALWVTNRSVAVWTTGGLETRQFTFFVLLGLYAVRSHAAGRWWLLLGSLSLALAETTRPEAVLIWGCCCAWWATDAAYRRRFRWRDAFLLAVPFVTLVAAHFAFRLLYYGELLPNTYYAKVVRPWPEIGARYVAMAALEYGLYLVIPLAVLGTIWRLRRHRDATHLLTWAVLLPHVAYLIRIGGDYFEFRPFDFHWPLLYVAAAEGLLSVAERCRPGSSWRRALAPALLALVLLYGTVISRRPVWLEWVPFLPRLYPVFAELMDECGRRTVGLRHKVHETLWLRERAYWQAYERFAGTGFLPAGAVQVRYAVGVMPFYLPDLTVLDGFGLTDRAVAHNPDTRPFRQLAHERQAPAGYLESRVNVEIHPAAPSAAAALAVAPWAVPLADDLWMPVTPADQEWFDEAFAGRRLVGRSAVAAEPAG